MSYISSGCSFVKILLLLISISSMCYAAGEAFPASVSTSADRSNHRLTIGSGAGNKWGCAIREDSEVVCWGFRQDSNNLLNPITRGVSNARQLSVYGSTACATNKDGKVFCWSGRNNAAAKEVAGISKAVSAIPVGNNTFCAILSNGVVKCWGNNNWGKLGDGTITPRSEPVDVVGVSGIVSLASADLNLHAVCGLKYSGGVYCWGTISNQRYKPTLIKNATSVRQVVITTNGVCLLRSNSSVYCSQENIFDFANYIKIQGLDNTKLISANDYGHICGDTEVDGTASSVKCFSTTFGSSLTANAGFATSLTSEVDATIKQFDMGTQTSCAVMPDNSVQCMDYWSIAYNCDIGVSGEACYQTPNGESAGSDDNWYSIPGLYARSISKPTMFTPPSSIKLESATTNSLNISFLVGSSSSSGFDVYYRVKGTSTWTRSTSAISKISNQGKIKITGLQAGIDYNIRVRGKTWGSYTPYTSVATFSTK